jgi:hypothetical protein
VDAVFNYARMLVAREKPETDSIPQIVDQQPTAVFTHAHEALQDSPNVDIHRHDIEAELAEADHYWDFKSHSPEGDIDLLPANLPLEETDFWTAVEDWSCFRFLSLFIKTMDSIKGPSN